ncbi:hypothetical protein [Pseudomonas phage Astolliot]|nr:hypothetical protein [Pseudomonas phage Astolliot]
MALEICVGSDVYKAGLTEDGETFTAERYFVVATATNGQRWEHTVNFKGCNVVQDEEGFDHFLDIREQARDAVSLVETRVKAHLAMGGKLDPAMWREVDPAYGSVAYQSLDMQGFFKERERQEDN